MKWTCGGCGHGPHGGVCLGGQGDVCRCEGQPAQDVVCEHGTASDVHCCNCHAGFVFDHTRCVCGTPSPEPAPAQGQAALVREKLKQIHRIADHAAQSQGDHFRIRTLARQALAALDAPGQAPEPQGWCYWNQDDHGGDETWETSCGHCFVFNEGGPDENGFAFCGYCGKAIHEQRTSEDADACARRDAVSAMFRPSPPKDSTP